MERTLADKWQRYAREMRRHALRSFVYSPPGLVLFFATIEYANHYEHATLAQSVGIAALYCYLISAAIYLVYGAFYAFLTHRSASVEAEPIAKKMWLHFALSLAGLTIGYYAADRISAAYFGAVPGNLSAWVEGLSTGALIGLAFIFYYAHRKSNDTVQELEKKTVEAQFAALKAQMHPHFLFNSLNAIAELIHENPDDASEMTAELADLYRRILDYSKAKTVPLSAELGVVRDYLALQKRRLGPRLHYDISLDGDDRTNSAHIPSLILQTLVENAIKHGVAPSRGGEIRLTIGRRPTGGGLRVDLVNTGKPFRQSLPSRPGTGLANTLERLELLYGPSHEFQIGTRPDGATEVSFCFSGERFD